MEVNIEQGCHDYADLYRILDGPTPSGDDKQDALAFVDVIRNYAPYATY